MYPKNWYFYSYFYFLKIKIKLLVFFIHKFFILAYPNLDNIFAGSKYEVIYFNFNKNYLIFKIYRDIFNKVNKKF